MLLQGASSTMLMFTPVAQEIWTAWRWRFSGPAQGRQRSCTGTAREWVPKLEKGEQWNWAQQPISWHEHSLWDWQRPVWYRKPNQDCWSDSGNETQRDQVGTGKAGSGRGAGAGGKLCTSQAWLCYYMYLCNTRHGCLWHNIFTIYWFF